MFKLNVWKIRENLRNNPYIANASFNRHFNGKIDINIVERVPTYMMKFINQYVYIDNQGYMLEVSEQKLELPILSGYKTEIKDVAEGNRLIKEDLLKLQTAIKIMNSANGNNISVLITEIDISDEEEYTLILENENKIVRFGNSSQINKKILWIATVAEKEKGIKGEIFVQNVDKVYFRETVSE
jgi:cell division protein FtsQ